jgi:predicted MPP superfamily phosphohydrolase
MISFVSGGALTRRQMVIGMFSAALGATGYSRYIEPDWLGVSRVSIGFDESRRHKPVRILHLSDLHLSRFAPLPLIEEAFRIGLSESPDIACLTGDFITAYEPYDRDEYGRALSRLAQTLPVYACLGNHDGGVWAMSRKGHKNFWVIGQLLEDSGIHVLHNRSEAIRIAGREIQLVGLGDLWANEVDREAAFRSRRDLPTIVLAHNPDTKDLISSYPWQVMLSGHTHGGQVVLPLAGPCFAPVKDRRYIAGLGEWNGRRIYVTRGVGNLRGYRFRCRPEVAILELT